MNFNPDGMIQSGFKINGLLTHWDWVTHICVSTLTIIGSDNGLSPGRPQAIIWTSDGILLIGPQGTSFSETLSKIVTLSLKKMLFKCRVRSGGHFVSASIIRQSVKGEMNSLKTHHSDTF